MSVVDLCAREIEGRRLDARPHSAVTAVIRYMIARWMVLKLAPEFEGRMCAGTASIRSD